MAIIDLAAAEGAARAATEGPAATHGTLAQGGKQEASSDFPPFDPANFAPQLVWLALIFGVLYALMARIALPRVASILSDRESAIETDLLASRELQAKAQSAAAENDATLRATKARAQAIGRAAQQQASAEAEARRVALDAQFSARLKAADAQIAAAKAQALAHVEDIAQDAAGSILQKLTGKPADPRALAAALGALKS
ncbi:MAG: ATPase [Methylocystis sp.]|nr:ATPase [Methylocystis sp.]MBI3274486.1 ATPase [Methylocystis sp.]